MYNTRRRKVRIIDVTNYKNSINFTCDKCGYVCHGKNGMKLHLKYSHGVEEKRNIVTESFCVRCQSVFYEPVSTHMIRHREEL